MTARFGNIGKLPSGRYRARYYQDGELKTAPFTFDTKGDAGGWLAEKQVEMAVRAHRPAEVVKAEKAAKIARKHLFGPYAASRIKARDISERTAEGYTNHLRRYLNPTFGDMPLVDITARLVRRWYDTMLEARMNPRGHGRKARADAYGFLVSVMHDAVRDEIIPANPCNIVGGSSARTTHIPVKLTPAQLHDLAAAMPERLRAMITLAAWCAPRYGEMAALRRCDVIEHGTEISITKAAIKVTGQSPKISRTKTAAGVRDVAMPEPVAVILRDHLERLTGPEPHALLFPSSVDNFQILAYVTFLKYFHRARKAIGEPTLHLHDLRHIGATQAALAGATTAELMQRIGHSTPAAAMRYQHANRAGDRRVAARLTEMMSQG